MTTLQRLFSTVVLLTLLPGLSGCMQSYYPAGGNRLTDFPTPPHDREVEVYLPGEKPADSSFIRTRIIEISGGDAVPYASMVKTMKERAKDYGVDAVVILSKEQQVSVSSNITLLGTILDVASGTYTPPTYYYDTYQVLAGLGIKYAKNIDYLEKYVRAKHVLLLDSTSGQYQPLADIFPDFDGHVKRLEKKHEQGLEYVNNYVKRYDLDFIVREENESWSFRTDEARRVVQRNFSTNDMVMARYKFYYNVSNQVYRIDCLPNPSLARPKEKIMLTYGTAGRLQEKTILVNNNPVLKEVLTYNDQGKLLESNLFKHGQKMPFLKVVYEYYSGEDVQQFISKENSKKIP